MKILFLSSFEGYGFAGPTYSVPCQIAAQSELDEVFWYNFKVVDLQAWRTNPFYHDPSYFSFSMTAIEKLFGEPDLMILEGFYNFHPGRNLFNALKSGIPYIIVPRCSLTAGDQAKKKFKKIIGNALYYRTFAKKAVAIHYLTDAEREESGLRWNRRTIVLPNGIDSPNETVVPPFCSDGIKAVFIGRLEPYQKGIDLLLEAISIVKELLVAARFKLDLYGESVGGSSDWINERIAFLQIEELVSCHAAVYGREKREILVQSDLFILTSRYEGMPMGLLEACSLGLPCLITAGTHLGSDVRAENAGWVCNQEINEISKLLVEAVDKSAYACKSNGAKRVADKYSWKRIAAKTHDSYLRILDEANDK